MKDPPSSASTGVVDPNVELILTDPHGFALLGLWTSPRVRFPCTPRAGETPAWAVTWRQTAKTSSPEAQIFVNMIILLGERDLARRWQKDLKEVGSKSGYYQKVDWKEKNGRKWNQSQARGRQESVVGRKEKSIWMGPGTNAFIIYSFDSQSISNNNGQAFEQRIVRMSWSPVVIVSLLTTVNIFNCLVAQQKLNFLDPKSKSTPYTFF